MRFFKFICPALKKLILYLIPFILHYQQSFAQCVNSFPYIENFETSQGGWTSGGTGNDWAWGTPNKPVISSAGSGTKCWVVGGLTGSFYALSERSYVQSPCFDFSTLQNPFISFKIFWEVERIYDGAVLQYSTDNGTTWANLGSTADATNCLNSNWFNSSSINNLSGLATPREGWSGNIQSTSGNCQGGGGSNGWVIAKHCMASLAGAPSVTLRFAFGAGSSCNDYDGFAFDSLFVGEAPANTADFTSVCNGAAYSFNAITSLCPTNLRWDFGDPASGGSNIANGSSVSHTFSAPGTYNVRLDVSGPCNQAAAKIISVSTMAVTASSTPVSCGGIQDGTATAIVNGGSLPFNFTWSTSPQQATSTATNLAAGTYNVTVTDGGGCSASTSTIVVTAPSPIVIVTSNDDVCGSLGGSARARAQSGAAPYTFSWSNGVSNIDSVVQLMPNNYTVTVTDSRNCTATASFDIQSNSGITISKSFTNAACFGVNNGTINLHVQGGALPYRFNWSYPILRDTIANRLAPGTYIFTVTDANNCFTVDTTVIDRDECESYVTFPTAFSPNNDGNNDVFRAKYSANLNTFRILVYNRWGERVFESDDVREGWDGYYKGMLQNNSVFAWMCEYTFNGDGEVHLSSGNVTLVR